MSSNPLRQFRSFEFKSEPIAHVYSARTGKPVTVMLKNLNNYQKEILRNTCDFIEAKLKGTNYEEAIQILMKVTGFCATSSKHVGGYSGEIMGEPLVIFNSKSFTGSKDEFAVTVLHELLHQLVVSDDRNPSSLEEAEHDIATYALLDVPIPLNHWAFRKYPELKSDVQQYLA